MVVVILHESDRLSSSSLQSRPIVRFKLKASYFDILHGH